MILTAGLLVLVGLGLFLAGVLTGTTAFYWACVAVCVPAFVLLFAARRGITRAEAAAAAGETGSPTAPPPMAPPSPLTAVAPLVADTAGEPPSARATGSTTSAAPGSGASGLGASGGASALPEPAGGPTPPAGAPVAEPPSTGAHAATRGPSSVSLTPETLADPPIEDVEVTDLLLIVDLKDEVHVVDEHPRYHLAGCRFLTGRNGIPLPMDEARVDGFTPCALCAPDRNLADRERSRKAGRSRST